MDALCVITPASNRIIANAIRPEETCIGADCLAYYQNISPDTTGIRAE